MAALYWVEASPAGKGAHTPCIVAGVSMLDAGSGRPGVESAGGKDRVIELVGEARTLFKHSAQSLLVVLVYLGIIESKLACNRPISGIFIESRDGGPYCYSSQQCAGYHDVLGALQLKSDWLRSREEACPVSAYM